MTNNTADYIIVGAGSTGCVIANRLSANPSIQVTVIEAGPRDWYPWVHVPVGYFQTIRNPRFDWCYKTEPDEGLSGRTIHWPRGKVLGGSSSLNGLLYVRGQQEDYDYWRSLGNTGWGWEDLFPLFKRSEGRLGDSENQYHGKNGPLAVSDMRLSRPICDDWVQAAQNAGYQWNNDYNGETQEGVGYFQFTAKNGFRCSSATAFLKPAKNRPNLRIITNAQVKRIIIEHGKALGICYTNKSNQEQILHCNREVIVSSGTIGSPQLLMLSGIGKDKELQAHGIQPVVHLPGVGKNLQDHLQARLIFKCNKPTLNDEVNGLFKKIRIGLEYLLFRTGPMTMAASLACAFLKTRLAKGVPDIQFHIQPFSSDDAAKNPHTFSAFTVSVCQLRPESAGYLELQSNDYRTYPNIHPKYLSTDLDCKTLVEAINIARRISRCEPLRSVISEEYRPTPALAMNDYQGTLEWARNNSTTIYHPTGTCKMGKDKMSVVNAKLQVHGIAGLRVADCSIMPRIVSGNTNAPAIMIGEKASDVILESFNSS